MRPTLRSRLRPPPAARYVHRKAAGMATPDAEWNLHIDVAEDNAPNHLRAIAELCSPHLGARVLDVGAGTGALSEHFAAGRELVALELSQWCIERMRERFAHASNVTVKRADFQTLDERDFDSITMINVLEHIEDDVGALRDLARLLRPGGRIVIYVPALNWLYSDFDRRIGHYRRYSQWRMRELTASAGLRVVDMRYVNALAIPGWALLSLTGMDEDPSGGMSLWDRVGVPVTRFVESRVRLPVGLNLFCAVEQVG